MEFGEGQRLVDSWVSDVAGGYWQPFEILARLTEEVGELAGALQREAGLRPRKQNVSVEEEVGDVLFTLIAFANAREIQLDDALRACVAKYEERDGAAWRSAQEQSSCA